MQDSVDTANTGSRPVIIYIIIAVVLFAALILGVRWAKNRADFYAQQSNGQTTASNNQGNQTANPSQGTSTTQQPSSQPQPSSSANESQNTPATTPSVASTTPAAPARVPSTGPEQVFLTLGSLSAVAFAGTSYVRARRRLQDLA